MQDPQDHSLVVRLEDHVERHAPAMDQLMANPGTQPVRDLLDRASPTDRLGVVYRLASDVDATT